MGGMAFNNKVHILLVVLLLSCTADKELPLDQRLEIYSTLSQEEKLSPAQATSTFEVAEGLEVTLFAFEPNVINPTNIDVDTRGRVWVCESYNYGLAPDDQVEGGGRITILEDTDHDGRADTRKVFYQGELVDKALGIAVLGNKVFITRSPSLLVFSDKDQDDIPEKIDTLFTGMGGPGDHSAHALIFGPDGRFYFNMGNNGRKVLTKDGELVTDLAGKLVDETKDYVGGMVFRCEPDGSRFEVLGHNFRNNYELTVDSYGNIWQSDNDDDGNESCRINLLLEYGNYGYRDEITRDSWRMPRTNLETSVQGQHWHQNDPGVVPNMLVTGAGSPAGITFYEGELLPESLRNQIIHTDAGPNVVWAVPATKVGAGYTAATENIVKSRADQWFRPVDVCVAPDGSLIVADWYDPGVGGGAAGDSKRGRIFRLAPSDADYDITYYKLRDVASAVDALKSPNMATRYEAWTYLNNAGKDAETVLGEMWQDNNPVYRARALWLLGRINPERYVQEALKDSNPDIRITGIRLARQLEFDMVKLVAAIKLDPAPEVLRELAIGLRYYKTTEASEVWAQLVATYDGNDRWFLEALGIGAMDNWDNCLTSYLQLVEKESNLELNYDLVWRARSKLAMPVLSKIISQPDLAKDDLPKFFRAFDFHTGGNKNEILLGLINLMNISGNLLYFFWHSCLFKDQ